MFYVNKTHMYVFYFKHVHFVDKRHKTDKYVLLFFFSISVSGTFRKFFSSSEISFSWRIAPDRIPLLIVHQFIACTWFYGALLVVNINYSGWYNWRFYTVVCVCVFLFKNIFILGFFKNRPPSLSNI